MTTSQASRVFGIPYNSLLMYVRGKYGKSLKLDTLRKETLEGEAMALAASTRGSYKLAAAAAASATSKTTAATHNNNNNNNSTKNHNNNNSSESKGNQKANLAGNSALMPLGAMATLGGFSTAMNPYLSYFCDFSFPPMSHAMLAALPLPPTSSSSSSSSSSAAVHRSARVKQDSVSVTEEEPDVDAHSPSPPGVNLRLAHALMAPLDLPHSGQVSN